MFGYEHSTTSMTHTQFRYPLLTFYSLMFNNCLFSSDSALGNIILEVPERELSETKTGQWSAIVDHLHEDVHLSGVRNVQGKNLPRRRVGLRAIESIVKRNINERKMADHY